MKQNNSNQFNKIYSFFSVILIGAIGSGFWDLFLKDLLFFLGKAFVKFASFIYDGYFDLLYANVGKQTDVLVHFPGVMIFLVIIISIVPSALYINSLFSRLENGGYKKEEVNELSKTENILSDRQSRLFKVVLLVIGISIFISYVNVLIISLSNIKAVNRIEQRIMIIRPYIEEKKYHKLVSQFRLVDNRKLLQSLVNEIEIISKDNNINLPELNLYGIYSNSKTQ